MSKVRANKGVSRAEDAVNRQPKHTLVVQTTHYPKFEGLNRAARGT
jgi:hypothetical protein